MIFGKADFKFYNEMDLPTQMRIAYNLKHRQVIRLKFEDTILTSLTKLVLKENANDQR